MKRTDARKPESGHAPRSNQPFFDAKAATAFFASGQSVQRDPFFQRPASASIPIQAKLTVGAVGDKYEQEADRVASSVVDQINRPAGPQGGDQSAVQRLGGEEEEVQMKSVLQRETDPEEEDELQMKPLADQIQREVELPEDDELQMKSVLQRETDPEEEDELQMKPAIAPQATTQGVLASPDLESSIQQARGSGHPIAETVRHPLEQAFGADFSRVRVHTDAKSDQLNQSIQAKAFTTGQDVFFRQGAYEPSSRGGQELIAHELTHVVQQGGGFPKNNSRILLQETSVDGVDYVKKIHSNIKSQQSFISAVQALRIQRVDEDIVENRGINVTDGKYALSWSLGGGRKKPLAIVKGTMQRNGSMQNVEVHVHLNATDPLAQYTGVNVRTQGANAGFAYWSGGTVSNTLWLKELLDTGLPDWTKKNKWTAIDTKWEVAWQGAPNPGWRFDLAQKEATRRVRTNYKVQFQVAKKKGNAETRRDVEELCGSRVKVTVQAIPGGKKFGVTLTYDNEQVAYEQFAEDANKISTRWTTLTPQSSTDFVKDPESPNAVWT